MSDNQHELLEELENNPPEPLAREEIFLVGGCLAAGTALLVALALAGLTLDQIDVIELNEAFAAQLSRRSVLLAIVQNVPLEGNL